MERACWQHKNNKLEILGWTVFRSWFNPTSYQTKWISDINVFLSTINYFKMFFSDNFQCTQWQLSMYHFDAKKLNIILTFASLDTRHMWHIRVYHLILSCTIPPVKISITTVNYVQIWFPKSKSNDKLLCVWNNNQIPRSTGKIL